MGIITNTTKERLEELEQQQETISEKITIEKSKIFYILNIYYVYIKS